MDSTLLPAQAFNRIPHFDDQAQTIATASLKAMAELFVTHGQHTDYCASLLHRHFDLQDSQIMVHQSYPEGADLCRAYDSRDLENSYLGTHSMFLDEKHIFRTFEYELEARRPLPHPGFLKELRDLLTEHGLEDMVAISAIMGPPTANQPMVETLVPRVKGMYSRRNSMSLEGGEDESSVVTGWSFDRNSTGELEVLEIKECRKNIAGIHEVFD
ncbi:MAG: hypothetical protein M1828_007004 [Chrysothrix sp. TS-e1954]|nr:MAG: hypothetical protein M1828_007004 [Chrysothrix sp. TS-e1954]